MVYSVSAYGRAWRWAASAGAHLWRTSIDIKDNWFRMSAIGFDQNGLERFAGPGHWNDPDMLEVGNEGADDVVGDGEIRRTPGDQKAGMSETEYRTHMSLWCLWSAPLADGAKAVGMFNRELGTMPVTVHFRDIAVGATASVRDLWARKDLGVFQDSFTARVPAHGVVKIKVK